MNIAILSIFVVHLLSLCHYAFTSSLEHDGALDIEIEHSLNSDANGDDPQFMKRGNISVHSIRIGQASVNQKELTSEESQWLRDLALNNKFYQIRTSVNGRNNENNIFISTVKACMLAEAELDDRLSISLDYAGRVVAISQVVAAKASCEGAAVQLEKLKFFTSNVYVRHTEMGPIPDTASYIQRLEREKEAKEKGEGKDNRTFLAKYWMYIVPVVIIMVISSASNADNAAATS